MVFLRDGTPIATSGLFSQSLMEAVPATLAAGEVTLTQGKETYLLRVHASEGWTAVGLMPQSRLRQMQVRTLQSSLLAGFVALMVGALMILLATRRLTRRMDLLMDSMDAMSGGNLDITVPVDATDEIGRVGAHFNTMVATTKELLAQVVEEENRKNKAEYDMLEYKYRSLQSQINPHFIYNALEVVNAMAKLDGNEAICDVVRHISSFFRQNGGNMNKRFITVAQEFSSLGQYASIYCYIYGDILSTPFHLEEAAAPALIPTMILQPVMENALVHGIRGEHAVVTLTARKDGDNRLSILVEDNGTGMPPETIAAILSDDAPVPVGESTGSGIGMRNVRDRLRLIYGEDCSLTIHSSSEGTRVEIGIPFRLRE